MKKQPYQRPEREKTTTPRLYYAFIVILFGYSTSVFSHEGFGNRYLTKTMTAIYSTPDQPHCIVSSTQDLKSLADQKDSKCNISKRLSDDQYMLLIVQDDKEDLRRFLINARTVMNWAYMAIHTWKLLDSGYKLLNPPACPCSGKPKIPGNSQKFFFSYYLLSYVNHGWSYITSFFPSFSDAKQENDEINENLETGDAEESIIHQISEQLHAGHLLTLALDSAALHWDCQCGGYFSDASGNFYFNGHLWMLMLNVGIFATDLSLEYL